MTQLDEVSSRATGEYELASTADHRRLRLLADDLLAADVPDATLRSLGADSEQPFDLRLATKLAMAAKRKGVSTLSNMIATQLLDCPERRGWGISQRRLRLGSRNLFINDQIV